MLSVGFATIVRGSMSQNEDKALVKALMDGDSESVSDALSRGANANVPMGTVTPLLWAVMFGPTECVESLIKFGADVNARDSVLGRTALHYASIAAEDEKVVKVLLAAGAAVNAKSDSGYTPLDHAAGACNEAVASVLAQAGGRCRADRRDWVARAVSNSASEKRHGR